MIKKDLFISCGTWVNPLLLCLFISAVISSCKAPPFFQTVPGLESKGLSKNLKGELVVDKPVGGLISISLPNKEEKAIRIPGASEGTVHAVSGPDKEGRIAIIENHMVDDFYLLKIYQTDFNAPTTIFKQKGDALWGDEIGDFIALSPTKGLVALVANLSAIQLHNPDAYLKYGYLEIWDTNLKRKVPIQQQALEEKLSWTPNSQQLIFVQLLDQAEAAALHRQKFKTPSDYGKTDLQWQRVPVVSSLNLESGRVSRIFIGQRALVSKDGKEVVMRDYDNNWAIFSIEGDFIKFISPPGITRFGAIYFDKEKILYWGLPTEGSELLVTENNSPLVGPKPMLTIKVAELSTNRFETIIPYIDPRRELSFGLRSP